MTPSGAVHVFWNSLREAIGANDTIRILEECERWEEAVVKEYEALLGEGVVSPAVKETLRRQKEAIEGEIEKLRYIRREPAAPSATEYEALPEELSSETDTMEDHVYKIIEIVGTSTTTMEDAVRKGLAKASKSVRNMRWFQVVETRGSIAGADVEHWQVTLKIGFTVDE
jgi:flavin-binding protein dodecin